MESTRTASSNMPDDGDGLPLCSPTVQRALLVLCWLVALVGGYAFGGAWHSCGVLLWHTLYVRACRLMQGRAGGYYNAALERYPRWSYWLSLLNGALVMPAMLWCACAAHAWGGAPPGDGSAATPDDAGALAALRRDDFLLPALAPGGTVAFWLAMGNAALCAGMLKDFVVYAPEGLELHFALHHLATVLGNIVCLAFGAHAGGALAALNSVVAELGSQCYNVDVLLGAGGGRAAKLLNVVGMTTSNAVIVLLTRRLWALPTPLWMRATYVALCSLIVLMRVAGTVLAAQALLAPSPPPPPSKSKKKAK